METASFITPRTSPHVRKREATPESKPLSRAEARKLGDIPQLRKLLCRNATEANRQDRLKNACFIRKMLPLSHHATQNIEYQ